VGESLVLTGLARENDYEGKTLLVKNGVFDGKSDAALVGVEVDAAGRSPPDGITADGLADAEGESCRKRRHKVGKGRRN